MSDVNDFASRVADNAWLKAVERVSIPLICFFLYTQYERLDGALAAIGDVKLTQATQATEMTAVKGRIGSLEETIDTSREARRKDWQEIRERIAAAEAKLSIVIVQNGEMARKLDALIERTVPPPRRPN
jgi:septal ring factor EnvC (AmiA/AmiB activator)